MSNTSTPVPGSAVINLLASNLLVNAEGSAERVHAWEAAFVGLE